jgi:hypothetical protein
MPALAGAADLAAICACAFYLALLLVASWIVGVLLGFTNVSVLGTHPLKNIATGALNAINKGLQDQIVATQDAISVLWAGLTWLIREGGNAIASLAGSTYGTFEYLASTKIGQIVQALTGNIAADVSALKTLERDLSNAVGSTSTSVADRIAGAVTDAENYTDVHIASLKKVVETDIANGVASAGVTAGQLVSQATALITKDYNELLGDFDSVPAEIKAQIAGLPAALDLGAVQAEIGKELASGGAIYNVISQRIAGVGGGITEQDITNAINDALAPGQVIYNKIESLIPSVPGGLTIDAVTAAISAALNPGQDIYNAIHDAVNGASGGLTESDITAAIAAALLPGQPIDAAIQAAIAGISIPVPPGGIPIPTPTLAQITAGLAAVTTTVAGIEAISFIGGQDCQNKVGQICNADSNGWESLLAGLASVGLVLTLEQAYDFVSPLVSPLADVIAEAA